jgi:AraC family transcriptional regulator
MKPLDPESDSLHKTPIRGGLSARKRKLVAEFIEAHLAEEISLGELATLVDLSRYHFAHVFRQTFGVSPHRYHMARRMEQAKNLLLQSTLPVTLIAIHVGFRETSSFTRAYRRHAGVTPSECRRSLGCGRHGVARATSSSCGSRRPRCFRPEQSR